MPQPRTILLVEDNPGDERLIRERAESHPTIRCDIHTCSTLASAIELLTESAFDVILLDLSLPDSHGLQTVQAVLRAAARTPVIVLTGATDLATAEQALQLGAEDYLNKGDLTADLLCRAVTYAIERSAHLRRIMASERRFRELAEMLPEVVFECDLDGTLTFVNEFAFEQFGYTREAFERGLSAFAMVAAADRKRAREGFARVLEGLAARGTQYSALRADGTTFPVTIHSTPVVRDGDVVGMRGIIVDITRQVEARQAMETADQIVSTIPSGIVIFRHEPPDRLILESGNPAASRFVESERHSGREFDELWPSEMVAQLKPDLLRVLHEGGVYEGEIVIRPRGRIHAFRARAFSISERRLVLAFEDITERKVAEAELRLKNEAFEEALAAQSITDAAGKLTYVNARFLEFWGYAGKEAVLGRPLAEFVEGGADADEILALLKNRGRWQGEFLARRADGSTFPCESYATAIHDDAGEFLASHVTHLDVTDRIDQQRILQESELRHRQLFESASVGIGYFTVDGTLLAVNRTAAARMGGAPEDFIGKNTREFTSQPEVMLSRLAEAARSHEGHSYEDQTRYKDELRYVLRTYTALRDAEDAVIGVQVIASDITDQKNSELRFRIAASAVSDLIYEWSPETDAVQWFGDIDAALGYPAGTVPQTLEGWAELIHPEDVDRFAATIRLRRTNPEATDEEYRVRSASGVWHLWQDRGRSLPGPGGTPSRWIGACIDITAQRVAEAAMRTAEEIVRASPAGMLIFRFEPPEAFRLEHANAEAERLTGRPTEEWRNTLLEEMWPFARKREILQACRDTYRSGEIHEEDDFIVQRGRISDHYRLRAFRIPNDRLVLTLEDVSSQREAEARLRDSEERYRNIVESSPIGIVTVDTNGRIATSNRAFLEMIGHEDDEIVGKHFTRIPAAHMKDLPNYIRTFRSIAAGVDPPPFEASWTTPKGEEHRGEVRARVMRGSKKSWTVQVTILDITERRKAQEALEESEARYRSLFQNAALGIYRTTPDGRILAANDALLRMLGYESFEQLAERNLEEETWYEPEAPRSQFRKLVEATDRLSGHEAAWKRRDGSTIYVREHARAVRDRNGNVLYYEGTLEDVTEAREMQRSLELTQFSIDSTRVMVLWVDPSGQLMYVNRAAGELLGYTMDELLGMHVWDLQRDYPRARRQQLWESLKDGGSVSEATLTRRDGATLPVEISTQYLQFRGAEYEFAVATDITDRKAAEAALKESEENYRTIFDSANDSIMLHDAATGRLLDVNQKTGEMFGFPLDEFVSLGVGDFSLGVPPYSDVEALDLIHAAAAGRPQVFEWRCRRKDGELFWTEVNLRAVTLLGRNVVLALVRDISERKELESRLWQSQRLESIGTLASGVAHEINNPLMGMINYAELISSRVEDEALRGFAEEIKVEGNRVARIVRNLLSFSRQDREQHSPARMHDIVNASLSIIGSLLRKDFVQIDLQVPDDLPSVRCRSQQIQQVLINLLTNARDSLNARFAGADEDKLLRIESEVVEEDGRPWLRTAVEDTGVGIAADVIDRIFDPFFTTKARNEGTGLGLSISYGIARDHGGRLFVASEPNRRTRFTLDLPLSEDESSDNGTGAVGSV